MWSGWDYNNAEAWQELIRAKQVEMEEFFKISYSEFRWYGAFHNEGHHPHVHMVVYSADEKSGYLTEKSVEKVKSLFANEVFKNNMYEMYDDKNKAREMISDEMKNKIHFVAEKIYENDYSESEVCNMLLELSRKLS